MAGELLGALRVAIIGDNSDLDKSLKDSEKKANSLGKVLKKTFVGIGVAVAAKAVFGLSKELINASSNAQETTNKFNVVFATVADQAKAASDRIRDEFKLSESTTENFLSGVGDITSGLGATSEEALLAAEQITALGLDIDSFANLSGGAEQAVSALTSLFTGEREAAKALGIVINDTNLKQYAEDTGLVFKELTPLEKGFLSLELATTQSQLAIGDFARSQDSFANQSKIALEAVKDLKVEIGEALLPTATTIVGTFGRLTGALAEFIDERNRLEEAKKAVTVGIADVDQRILLLNEKNNELQLDLNKKLSGRAAILADGLQISEADKKVYEEQIKLIEDQIAANNRLLGGIQLRKILQGEAAEAERQAERKRLEALEIQAEAESLLDDRLLSRRTSEEVQIDLLNEQIAKWVEFREIPGVQALINDLVSERNKLLLKQGDSFVNLTFQANAYENSLMDATFAHRKFTDETIEGLGEAASEWDLYYANLQANAAQSTSNLLGYSSNLFSQLSALRLADAAQETELIDANLQTALDALDKEALGEEAYNDKVAELTKEANNEKAAIEYEAETASWKLKKLSAVASAAQAIVQGFAQLGPIGGAIAAVGTGILTGVQLAIIEKQKPVLQTFADGGIVAGQSFTGDRVPVLANSGEAIINRTDQKRLMDFIQGGSNNGMGNMRIVVNLDKKPILDVVSKGTRNGTLVIDSRSVK